MKKITYLLLLAMIGHSTLEAQEIPANFQLLYEQSFDNITALEEFEMTDPKAWKISGKSQDLSLEIHQQSEYSPRVRSPFNIAIIRDRLFGSFVLEADLQQTGKEYGHRDLCLFFGMKDPANFYYVHIASIPDPHAHNIFLVNDEPRVAIGKTVSDGVDWGATDEWHKVKIVRDIEKGSIEVYFDDMSTPIMQTEDHHFNIGHIGFGTFDDVGKFDNIKIWGPEELAEPMDFFGN
ncbi:hypothetical protein DN752_07595 [Echinicola strongylocentroti]|uniref:Uncharacterized protein n=1 Tax=Echinicola strongylocentroti TaxID=1795355 RepID=A0A2Z4IHM6_9BACT|nr:hypothetical protein [Echinicola strongylocentroti]AWW29998.1 hypothetical protein DN752_07595 [Echinicola strongylocentroti]